MKYTFLFLLVLAITFTSCKEKTQPTKQIEPRIKGKGVFHLYATYEIIEIDGVEYLSTYQGGLCPLVKDTTSKKTVFKIND